MAARILSSPSFTRLVRFIPRSEPSKVLLGQPVDDDVDVGAAVVKGEDVRVKVFSGASVLDAGQDTGETAVIEQVLSPLTAREVGSIRCIGLNYVQHAQEVGMDLPALPTVFLKPETSLAGPWPQPTILPKLTQQDDSGDYESELAVVIGKAAKNVSEADAMEYVLGYTASNDVSSRGSQFAQSQWSFSKSFDTACPMGPTLVSKRLIPDPGKLRIKGIKNGETMQECGIDDLIFGIPRLISFLSQGTTLPPGTTILTGTPAGVGTSRKPKVSLRAGDTFEVVITPYIGTLHNRFENEE